MPISQPANAEAPTAIVPAGKRVPFGWSAFAVAAAQSTLPVVLSWPRPSSFKTPMRLRVTTALDVRENKLVEARTAQTNELLGTFDIRFASICQPFEIVLAPEKVDLAAREGVRLQMTRGEAPLWLFDGKGGAPDAFAPQWIGVAEGDNAGDKWAQFEARMCSLASVQAFGWIEGCVMDGLWQMARVGHPNARGALEAHRRLFVSTQGDLDYEGPGSNPLYNTLYGMEGLLPFAIIAQMTPENRVLDLAIDYCQKHHDAQGAVIDGSATTTEGAYIAGYPLAVIGKVQKRDDLTHLALMQLRTRRDRNVQNDTIFQMARLDGNHSLPNWARGVAWYLLGFARVLDVLNPGDEAADLYQEFKRAALWVMGRQQADGLWRNFFDDANSAADTSGSSGIATSLALGARRGWLPSSARAAAQNTLDGLENYLTPDGFLGGMAQFNKGGEALQRAGYRVMAPMAMGLAAQLRAELAPTAIKLL